MKTGLCLQIPGDPFPLPPFFLLSALARTGRQVRGYPCGLQICLPFHRGRDLLRPSTSPRKGSSPSSWPLTLVWAAYSSTDSYICLCFPPCTLFFPLSSRDFSCLGMGETQQQISNCTFVNIFNTSFTKEGFSKCLAYHTPQSQQPFNLFFINFPIIYTNSIIPRTIYPVMLFQVFTVPLAVQKQ